MKKNIQGAREALIKVTQGQDPTQNLHTAVAHLAEALENQDGTAKNIILDHILEIRDEAHKMAEAKDVPAWVQEYANRNRIRCNTILALL